MSGAPRRSSERWSGGPFVGCRIPLPGARRGHLIRRVIDKCGRGAAVPTSPSRPRSSSLLPAGSRPASCQKRWPPARRSSGDLPALGGAARARRRAPAPGPRRLPRLPAGRCRGRLRGKLRVARSPGKFWALGSAALGPQPCPAGSPRGGGGSGAGGPRWPPPPARARWLRDGPRGRGRAPGVARPRGHRRPGASCRSGGERSPARGAGPRGEGSAGGRRACGPRLRVPGVWPPRGRARRAGLAVGAGSPGDRGLAWRPRAARKRPPGTAPAEVEGGGAGSGRGKKGERAADTPPRQACGTPVNRPSPRPQARRAAGRRRL